jgi:hypothetical protein
MIESIIKYTLSPEVIKFLMNNSTVVYKDGEMYIQPMPIWYKATKIVGEYEVCNKDPRNDT